MKSLKIILMVAAVFLVVAGLGIFSLTEFSDQAGTVLGAKENIRIISPSSTVEAVARIDTGAAVSSIDIKLADSLGLEPIPNRRVRILNPGGVIVRNVVELTFVIEGKTISTTATRADRSSFSTPILIGRQDLEGFSVDPNLEFLTKPGESTESARPSFVSVYLGAVTSASGQKEFIIFPILGALIVFLRLMIGGRTYGLFAPVVIAISLFEVNVFQGLMVYLVLVTLGISIKLFILDKLYLPHVSEIAIIMFMNVAVLLGISYVFVSSDVEISSLFFPLLITSHLIERASKYIEENDVLDGVWLMFITLLVAVLLAVVGRLLLNFEAVTLWILFAVFFTAVIFMGRYLGLRLSELKRFKFLKKEI